MTSHIVDEINDAARLLARRILDELPSPRSPLFFLGLGGALITDGNNTDFAKIRDEGYRILQVSGHAFFCASLVNPDDINSDFLCERIQDLIDHLSGIDSPATQLLNKSLEILRGEFEPGQSTLFLADEIEKAAGAMYEQAVLELLRSQGLGNNETAWGEFARRSYVFVEATKSAQKGEVAASLLGKLNQVNWLPGGKLFFVPPHCPDIFGALWAELLGSTSTGRPYGEPLESPIKSLPEIPLMGIRDPKLQSLIDDLEVIFQEILEEKTRAEFERINQQGSAILINETSIIVLRNGKIETIDRPAISHEGVVLMAYDICHDLAHRQDLKFEGRMQIAKKLNLNSLYGLGADDLVYKLKEFMSELIDGKLNYKGDRILRFNELTKEPYQSLLEQYNEAEVAYLKSVIPEDLPEDTYFAVNSPQAACKSHPILQIIPETNVVFCRLFTKQSEALSAIARISFVHRIMRTLLAKGEGDITAGDHGCLDPLIRDLRDDNEQRDVI